MSAHEEQANRPGDYVGLLLSLSGLLYTNGNHHQAGVLTELAERIASGQPLSVLDTNDVWGGAGSVVDCSFLLGANPSDEGTANEARFGELIIRLVDLLDQDGVATDLMRSRRRSYLFWKGQRERKAGDQ